MKLKFSLILFSVFHFISFGQTFNGMMGDKLICFDVKDNQLNGPYASYIKAPEYLDEPIFRPYSSGNFTNGVRTGTWNLYDENGNVIFQRNYDNPFEFDQLIPTEIQNNENMDSAFHYDSKQVRETSQLYPYFPLVDKDIALSFRVWRELPLELNMELVNPTVYAEMIRQLNEGNLTAYEEDQFINSKSQKSFNKLDNLELVSFRIKEDFFIDHKRQMSETRVIGLCPVVKNHLNLGGFITLI